MTTNPSSPIPDTARKEVWDFVKEYYPCLIKLVCSVAGEHMSPPPEKKCQLCLGLGCPKPINYLMNAAPPGLFPTGLTSYLPPGYVLAGSKTCLSRRPRTTPVFNGCNFGLLAELANEKNGTPMANLRDEQLRGFNLYGVAGLSILLGPWADYCLWCWSSDPSIKKAPILILGKDNSTFAEHTVVAGQDWGVDQVIDTARVRKASDRSTQRLFGAIEQSAKAKGKIVEYICQERILVCNAWPWFRCGQEASGDDGIHSTFSSVHQVKDFLTALLDCLKPTTVVCLGDWAGKVSGSTGPSLWIPALASGGAPPTFHHFPHPASRGGFWTGNSPAAPFIEVL